MRRETREGLEAFRKLQDEADKRASERDGGDIAPSVDVAVEEQWVAGGRKRKRARDTAALKGVKRQNSLSTSEVPAPKEAEQPIHKDDTIHGAITTGATHQSSHPETGAKAGNKSVVGIQVKENTAEAVDRKSGTSSKPNSGLGLVDYGSDDD